MKRICVFCGTNNGARTSYTSTAQQMGVVLAQRGIELVYGGGRVGLMGAMADAALQAGGKVIGIIPKALADVEVEHQGVTEQHIVHSMHERKAMMAELADGFIAMPGGYGTLEELCEMITWSQLGVHQKPCGVLNINGFFDMFLAFIDHAVAEEFIRVPHRSIVLSSTQPDHLLDMLIDYKPSFTPVARWMKPSEA